MVYVEITVQYCTVQYYENLTKSGPCDWEQINRYKETDLDLQVLKQTVTNLTT